MPTGSIRIFFNKTILCLKVNSDAEPTKLGINLINQLTDLLTEFGFNELKSKFVQLEIVESESDTPSKLEQTQLGDFTMFDDYNPSKRQCFGVELPHSDTFSWDDYYTPPCPPSSSQLISLKQILEDGIAVTRPFQADFNYIINLNQRVFSSPEAKWKISLKPYDLQMKLQVLSPSSPLSSTNKYSFNTTTTRRKANY